MTEDVEAFMKDFSENVRVQGSIPFPVEVASIEMGKGVLRNIERVGKWVSIRPCDGDKTYLGVYLGDLNVSPMVSYHIAKKTIDIYPHTNPAIYVPDLKRVVWGYESWWGVIDGPDGLRKITDTDINDVWYVKALRELSKKDD